MHEPIRIVALAIFFISASSQASPITTELECYDNLEIQTPSDDRNTEQVIVAKSYLDCFGHCSRICRCAAVIYNWESEDCRAIMHGNGTFYEVQKKDVTSCVPQKAKSVVNVTQSTPTIELTVDSTNDQNCKCQPEQDSVYYAPERKCYHRIEMFQAQFDGLVSACDYDGTYPAMLKDPANEMPFLKTFIPDRKWLIGLVKKSAVGEPLRYEWLDGTVSTWAAEGNNTLDKGTGECVVIQEVTDSNNVGHIDFYEKNCDRDYPLLCEYRFYH